MTLSKIQWQKLRERAGGVAFALVFNLLLLLALLTLAPRPEPKKVDDRLPTTFDTQEGKDETKDKSQAQKSEKKKAEKSAQAQSQPVVRPAQPVEKPAEQVPSPFPFLSLNRQQMAAADIGKMAKSDAGAGKGASGASMQGPGEGPGGVQLFNAEWYRRPTDAELGAYLPSNAPGSGWGEVACRTVDHYHVENCQILGESPLGSGFAKAVRLAAWQFLVLPPRVNGQMQVGSWVRIHIDYSRTVVRGPGGGGGGSNLGLGGGDGRDDQ